MISFIIIGKNLQTIIETCISSVQNTITENKIEKHEIIYVDSGSVDSTIAAANKFNDVKVIQLKKKYNAAIGRNMGFKASLGSELIFLDGDMELNADFLPHIFDQYWKLKYDFVSGDLVNYFYDQNWKFTNKTAPYFGRALNQDTISPTCGGVFAIKRSLWEALGGMKHYYRRSQDIDFSLRLAKKGVFLVRKKEKIVNHHTISYYEKTRFKEMICRGDFVFNGLIARQHFFNKYAFKRNISNNSSAIILLGSILAAPIIGLWSIGVYFTAILVRSVLKRTKEGLMFYSWLLIYLLIDLQSCYGFLLFFPKEERNN